MVINSVRESKSLGHLMIDSAASVLGLVLRLRLNSHQMALHFHVDVLRLEVVPEVKVQPVLLVMVGFLHDGRLLSINVIQDGMPARKPDLLEGRTHLSLHVPLHPIQLTANVSPHVLHMGEGGQMMGQRMCQGVMVPEVIMPCTHAVVLMVMLLSRTDDSSGMQCVQHFFWLR